MMARTLICCALILCGCEKAVQGMYDQAHNKAYSANPLFPDGTSARHPPQGTQAYAAGPFAGTSSGRVGAADVAGTVRAESAQSMPYPVDEALLKRGQERYSIYCLPCHSPLGDGDGLVVRRGFPRPPNFDEARLRQAPDRYFFDVITHGHGIMYSYADRVAPQDRWAIAAYIRVLQTSARTHLDDLPPTLRREAQAALKKEDQK